MRSLLFTLLFLMTGVTGAWGQIGIWYIANDNNNSGDGYIPPKYNIATTETNFYLVPARNPQQASGIDAYYSPNHANQNGDPEKPFLATHYITKQDLNAAWIIISSGENNYYFIIHAETGKYVIYEPPLPNDNDKRKSMHLQEPDDNNYNPNSTNDNIKDKFKFKITVSGSNYLIEHKNRSGWYWNTAGQNSNNYYGTKGNLYHLGLVGVYNNSGGNSVWHLEDGRLAAPTISNVSSSNTITITDANNLPDGYTIRYTTGDGTQDAPTATTGTVYSGAVTVDESMTVKAVVVRYGIVLTNVATKAVAPVVAKPLINFDNSTNKVTLSCTTPGADIYYNTGNGSQADPTTSTGTHYTAPFDVTSPTTVKAISSLGGESSSVATLTIAQVATPTIQNNGSNAISITCATDGATIYYTTDGSTPTKSSTEYTGPLTENVSGVTIKAIAVKENMINSAVGSGAVTLQCASPIIVRNGNNGFTVSCPFPSSGVTIYYTIDGSTPTTSSNSTTSGGTVTATLPVTVKAMAVATGYNNSTVATVTVSQGMGGDGSAASPYTIEFQSDVADFITKANTADGASKHYKVIATDPLDFSGAIAITQPFSGTFDGGLQTITNLGHALFNTVSGGTVKNVILKDVTITTGTNVGAICNEATGASRIYNCGVLATTDYDLDGNITGFSGSSISGTGAVGSIVGLLDGTSRVINCYSYANLSGGSNMGGIVGNNSQTSTMSDIKTIVVNCMFYGEISGSGFPVYGGNVIENSGTTAINNYNYYRGSATFDDNYGGVSSYNRSWPAEEEHLTRFEYYRSILNSNRKLCTWWVNGTNGTAPSDADMNNVGIAKWVLDPSIAPYPVLKKWGKYPSVINPDETQVWDPRTKDSDNNPLTPHWVTRSSAPAYQGKSHGTLTITVNTGSYPSTLSGLSERTETWKPVITEMDTLNYDYGYYKVQLPYYNEVFGDPDETEYLKRYWGNYTNKVVTAWKITAVDKDGSHSFVKNWENGYNYADRNCTDKDLYDSNGGRAFAQGGYYYVPEGVTAITIEAYWGDAFYLHGKGHALDRVSVCSYEGDTKNYGYAFTPAGTLPSTMPFSSSVTIYDDFKTLMTAVKAKTGNVYEQAVVLVGNYPLHARNDFLTDVANNGQGGLTIMSADFDIDNEPDFCMPFQWRSDVLRHPIMPIRFDFLPVPELGLAMRHNTFAYAIGVFIPEGHFEITETSFMHTTQFEYMSKIVDINHQQPLILNGGQFEQIVCHSDNSSQLNYVRNIILGGHLWMKRFTPGSHTKRHCIVRHCAVSVMGGDFPEFYLTGIYWDGVNTTNAYNDNPHCYTNGGRFGIMAGAGMEAVKNSVYFEIDHSIIDEFYGGGINSSNPVAGNINVTINNSLVNEKYCGGPKVGTSGTVTTNASGTIFNQFFGGGNGGTNLYREQIKDETPSNMPGESKWDSDYGFTNFKPISGQGDDATYSEGKGYHAEFEFEVFNQSNGLGTDAVARTYRHWAQFGVTSTGNVTNTLTDCTFKNNFYGGGNLATVSGNVTSTLTDCTVTGSAFGAGFSASIPSFPVHDKTKVTYPTRDAAGVCHNGKVGYRTDGDVIRQYTWCYKNSTTNEVLPAGVVIPQGVDTSKPAFQYGGKWYCYTTVPLENLGTVTGNATLTITGNSNITGDVFGGGDQGEVKGNTTVNIRANP